MSASRELSPAVSGPVARTAWVVLGSSGQYSDWSQWAVCVCLDEQTAKDRVGELSSATRIHWAKKPGPGDGETFDDWWDRPEREALSAAWEAGCEAIDPGASEYDQPSYRASEVPLIAAITRALPPQVGGSGDQEVSVSRTPNDRPSSLPSAIDPRGASR